jgi:hypothetical protein
MSRRALLVARGNALVVVDDGKHDEVAFVNPPLNEVSFSIQFETDVVDEVVALSAFLPKVRDQFPGLEKHPPVPPATETFEMAPSMGPQLQLMAAPPTSRYWFISDDSTKIIQVQADRLMFNWRKVRGDEVYPRYAHLLPEFVEIVGKFLESLQGPVSPVAWVELQYINPIQAVGDTPGTHGQLARILRYLERDPERRYLPPVEDTQLQQRFRIEDGAGTPIGRLYVIAVPALDPQTMQPVYLVTMLARGRPGEGDLPESAVGFFEQAHDLIVHGFREVTTDEMHKIWGMV